MASPNTQRWQSALVTALVAGALAASSVFAQGTSGGSAGMGNAATGTTGSGGSSTTTPSAGGMNQGSGSRATGTPGTDTGRSGMNRADPGRGAMDGGIATDRMPQGAVPGKAELAPSAFGKLDANRRGYVTRDDVSQLQGFDAAFRQADANKDGRLSQDEFNRAWSIYSNQK